MKETLAPGQNLITQTVKDIVGLLAKGVKTVNEAANLLVYTIDKYPELGEQLIQEMRKAGLSYTIIKKLKDIGRGRVDSRLLYGGGGPHTVKIAKLDKQAQTQIIDGGKHEYLTVDGSKKMVVVRDCEEHQAKQMFAKDHIRTLPEQKNWIESQKAIKTASEVENDSPYVSTSKGIVVRKPHTLITWKEVKRLLLDR